MKPELVLKKYWGYDSFRLSQKEVVESILSGRDTLALLPTGGGKSICYQVPGLLFSGLTLVITPLISLMKDQVDGLLKKNISATFFASTLEKAEQEKRTSLLMANQYKFLYVSPEKLQSQLFAEKLKTMSVSQVVIDEAHCIGLWGSDFRPSYLKIASFIDQLNPRPVIAALTATATLTTKKEIVAGLQLINPRIFQSSFKRNISIRLITTSSLTMHEMHLLAYLKNRRHPGIIYTSSKKETERLSKKLSHIRHMLKIGSVGYYHAGLSANIRQEVQQDFIENKLQLLIATTAFGMGIDKPDIDFVVHYHPPASLEGYYQEIGRAGRSGHHSSALLLFNPTHLSIHEGLLSKRTQDKSKKMFEDVQFFLNSQSCRMQNILNYFGEKSEMCGMCDNCFPQESELEKIILNKMQQIQSLVFTRAQLAKKYLLPPEMILNDNHILYWIMLEPSTPADLKFVPGIGQGWLELWGKYFLSQ